MRGVGLVGASGQSLSPLTSHLSPLTSHPNLTAMTELPKHPKGTFAFLLAYVILFVAGWMAVYTYLYLGRGGVGE